MMKFLESVKARVFFILATGSLSGAAMATETGLGAGGAGTIVGEDSFDSFEATLLSWANGPLGVGLAITALIIGGGLGLIRASPMPALAGIALAAFFAWGPGIIVSMVGSGATL